MDEGEIRRITARVSRLEELAAAPPPEPLPAKARREILMFLLALLLAGTAVGCLLIVNDVWSEGHWSELGSLANIAEAVGVLAALLFAYRQLTQARDSDERRRTHELVDRLTAATCDRFAKVADEYRWAWLHLLWHGNQFGGERWSSTPSELTHLVEKWDREKQDAYDAARDRFDFALDEVRRAFVFVGRPEETRRVWTLEVRAQMALPRLLGDWPADPITDDPIEAFHQGVKELVRTAERIAERHRPRFVDILPAE